MFDTLSTFFAYIFEWFAWLFTELWRQVCNVVWSVWSVVGIVCTMLIAFFDWLQALVGQIVDLIGAINLPNYDVSCDSARYYLELMNTFLPVSETFAILIAYAALLGLLLTYKGIKSLKSWVWAS